MKHTVNQGRPKGYCWEKTVLEREEASCRRGGPGVGKKGRPEEAPRIDAIMDHGGKLQ